MLTAAWSRAQLSHVPPLSSSVTPTGRPENVFQCSTNSSQNQTHLQVQSHSLHPLGKGKRQQEEEGGGKPPQRHTLYSLIYVLSCFIAGDPALSMAEKHRRGSYSQAVLCSPLHHQHVKVTRHV